MLDIKAIRQNPEEYKRKLKRKGVEPSEINQLLHDYEEFVSTQMEAEDLRAQKNITSKQIPNLSEEQRNQKIMEMKIVSESLKRKERELSNDKKCFEQGLESLPNPPADEAPDGESEEENVVLRKEGNIPEFDFEPKEHWELAENLGLLDMERAAKISGSRFYFLKNELAVLQMALMNWAFLKIVEKGFTAMIPPFMTRKDAIYGTGYLAKGENYVVNPGEDNLYLIGTSEVPLTSYHADEILDEKDLPVKFAGYSPCFRREAGSYGKDMKGILRVHQFEKIEMVILCKPEESVATHEMMREVEEEILRELSIPYQVVNICCGDLGSSAAKKYDLEAWLPGQGQYREMTSTSICTDFQARRLNIRYRDENGDIHYVHTLNGTAVSSRPLIAIFENFQRADGSIAIPECLWKFTGFKRIEARE